jgi:tetrahydromethanopterin S-methyltransferase subunit D
VISPGNSSAAGANAPQFLEITQTIVGGTGALAGATGSGTGRVNLAAGAVITASGTITLP